MSVKSRIAELNARLADTLTEKGVQADASETTTALVGKVAQISQGGDMTPEQALQIWAGMCYDPGEIRGDETLKTVGDLTFTRATGLNHVFRETKLEQVDVITAPEAAAVSYLFYETRTLQKVGGVVAPKAQKWNSCFSVCKSLVEITNPFELSAATDLSEIFAHCNALKEVRFVEGSIPVSVKFNNSPLLSAASVQSIIDGLADLTGSTTQTLTFHAAVAVSDEQKAAVTLKNWTLVQ